MFNFTRQLFFTITCAFLFLSWNGPQLIACVVHSDGVESVGYRSLSEIYDDVVDGVAFIGTETKRMDPCQFCGTAWLFKYDDSGTMWFVTNYHVVKDHVNNNGVAEDLGLFFGTREGISRGNLPPWSENQLIFVEHFDVRRDLAIVRVHIDVTGFSEQEMSQWRSQTQQRVLKLACSEPRPGQSVFSIGSPSYSTFLFNFCRGTVRQCGKRVGPRIHARIVETDSAINGGDSGGPLFNEQGQVVGVATSYQSGARLVSHFISITEVCNYLDEIQEEGFLANWDSVSEVTRIKLAEHLLWQSQWKASYALVESSQSSQGQRIKKIAGRAMNYEFVDKDIVNHWCHLDFGQNSQQRSSVRQVSLISSSRIDKVANRFVEIVSVNSKLMNLDKVASDNRKRVFASSGAKRRYAIRSWIAARSVIEIEVFESQVSRKQIQKELNLNKEELEHAEQFATAFAELYQKQLVNTH